VGAAAIQNNLAMLADLAVANGIRPLLASILPVSDHHREKDPAFEMTLARSPAVIREINKWLQEFCQRRGFTYVDYFTAMADGQGFLKAELADDGLHPNSGGYRVMAPIAQTALDSVLTPAPGKRTRKN